MRRIMVFRAVALINGNTGDGALLSGGCIFCAKIMNRAIVKSEKR
jgi:hypothetical protein